MTSVRSVRVGVGQDTGMENRYLVFVSFSSLGINFSSINKLALDLASKTLNCSLNCSQPRLFLFKALPQDLKQLHQTNSKSITFTMHVSCLCSLQPKLLFSRDYGFLELLSRLGSKGGLCWNASAPWGWKPLFCALILTQRRPCFAQKSSMPTRTAHRNPPCWKLHKSSSAL